MRYSILALLFTTLLCLLVQADENFCTGDFKKHDSICKKFEFDDKTDEEKCGTDELSDDPSDDTDDDGMKLSNCTT